MLRSMLISKHGSYLAECFNFTCTSPLMWEMPTYLYSTRSDMTGCISQKLSWAILSVLIDLISHVVRIFQLLIAHGMKITNSLSNH